jgi:hypothetical protein
MRHLLARFFFAPVIVILIYSVFFQHLLIHFVSDSFFYTDEALVVMGILVIFLPLQKNTEFVKLSLIVFTFFIGFYLLSFNSYSFRSELTIITQNLLHFKAFFLFLLIYNFREYINSRLIVHSFLVMSIVGVVLNLVLGAPFSVAMDGEVAYRFGLLRPVGVQGHTGNLGITFAFLYIFYMFYLPVTNYVKQIPLFIGSVVVFGFSSLRTPFVALVLSLAYIFGSSWKKMLFGSIAIAIVAPLFFNKYFEELILLTLNDLTTDPTESQYIRGIMVYFSVILAAKYFPFGTGAASYGTFLSDNSPVYQEIGLSTSYFFQTNYGIYDSNFASVLGEFGVLGISLFGYIIYRIFQLIVRNGATRSFAVVFAGLIAFYSLVNPIFMSSYPAMLMAIVLVAAVPRVKDLSPELESSPELENSPELESSPEQEADAVKENSHKKTTTSE